MSLSIFYWLPIMLFGAIYMYRLTNDLAKARINNRKAD